MCEANVYIHDENEEEQLFLERVDKIIPYPGNEIYLENIFGKRKFIQARIKEMALVEHRVILERMKE